MPWKTRDAIMLSMLWRDAPPQAEAATSKTVPNTNMWRLPQMRPEGTTMKAAAPTPKRYQPVSSATPVKGMMKSKVRVRVLAARMGPREVAKMAVRDRTKVMRSRFHSGQLSGSLGSSDGCGTRMMGIGPLVSHLRPWVPSAAYCGLSGSSKYLVVPAMRHGVSKGPRGSDAAVAARRRVYLGHGP